LSGVTYPSERKGKGVLIKKTRPRNLSQKLIEKLDRLLAFHAFGARGGNIYGKNNKIALTLKKIM
jgi:hypothetical protein